MNLKEQRKQALDEARAIAERAKSAGRDLTDAEVTTIDAKVAEVAELDKKITAAAKSKDGLDRLAGIGKYESKTGGLDPFDEDGSEWPAVDAPVTTLFSSKHAGELVARGLMTANGPGGQKAVPTSVARTIPIFVDPEPVGEGGRQDSIFDIIPAVTAITPAWTYRRATTRELDARIVGTGEVKPSSVLDFEDVTNKLGVIATLAGPISEQTLQDYRELVRFINTELLLGIRLRLEDEVFSGSGEPINSTDDPTKVVGEHFQGILNTTGVLEQAFTGDGLGSIAVATTRLEADGYTLSGIAIHPDDWVTLTTARNASGAYDLGGPVDPAARTVWGHPVRLTRGLPAGTALAVTAGSAAIRPHLNGLEARAVTINDDAARNQVRIRVEGRFGFDLYRPGGLCTIQLTDDEGDEGEG
ncbi:phage major capsid protein [Brachybacterium sp. AOP43-C2-M15]|uniref:phage major capsid protein n=1 Tax=Brachybacterium sp. AOP43-C2-M15 TaxID=3457661 RepID=UPI004034F193